MDEVPDSVMQEAPSSDIGLQEQLEEATAAEPITSEALHSDPPPPPPPPAEPAEPAAEPAADPSADAATTTAVAVPVPASSPASAAATLLNSRAPKEPKTGYNFFCDMRRPQLLVEHPEAKPAEISKMLGEGWKQLNTAELRQPYEAQAATARARFVQECAALGIDPHHRKSATAAASAD